MALRLFGFETLFRGWLIYRSEFLPRFLGVLSMLGGLWWLTYLWSPLGSQAFMAVALFAIISVVVTTGFSPAESMTPSGRSAPPWLQRRFGADSAEIHMRRAFRRDTPGLWSDDARLVRNAIGAPLGAAS